MKTIHKILFPTDFSDTANHALGYALWFAAQYNASVKFVHIVYPEVDPIDLPSMAVQATTKRLEAAKEKMKIILESTLATVQNNYGLEEVSDIESEVVFGAPSTYISKIARQEKMDLIIMGTKGKHNAFDKRFGSVTTATLRNADCPILVIPEKFEFKAIKTVAYATDLKEDDPYHIWSLSKFLFPFNYILRLVHIQKSSTENTSLKMEDMELFFKEHSPSLQIAFHNVLNKNVIKEMGGFVTNWGVDLLVMYQPERSFFEQLFHTSFTKRAVLNIEIPLLVMK